MAEQPKQARKDRKKTCPCAFLFPLYCYSGFSSTILPSAKLSWFISHFWVAGPLLFLSLNIANHPNLLTCTNQASSMPVSSMTRSKLAHHFLRRLYYSSSSCHLPLPPTLVNDSGTTLHSLYSLLFSRSFCSIKAKEQHFVPSDDIENKVFLLLFYYYFVRWYWTLLLLLNLMIC